MGSMKPEQDVSTQAEIITAMRDAWLQSVDDGAASAVRLDASTLAEEVISIVEGMGYAKEVAMDVGGSGRGRPDRAVPHKLRIEVKPRA